MAVINLTQLGTTISRTYFHVAGESMHVPRPLQFFCKSLPFYISLEQRKLFLWMQIRRSNIVLRTLYRVNYHELIAICS